MPSESMSLLALIEQGGITLIPLGICSILVIAVVLERWRTFSRLNIVPQELLRRVEGFLSGGHRDEAFRLLDETDNPYARVAKASLVSPTMGEQELSDMLTLAADSEVDAASAPLPILGTIGNVAPFIGLLGTVIGIMRAFHEVAQQGQAGANVVSRGISEALIATAVGLGVGIIAVIANNWCTAWVDRFRLRLERFSTEWSYRLHRLNQRQSADDAVREPVS
jgi:biopolymer transport protein ExbB